MNNTLGNAEPQPQSAISEDFQNQEYRFTTPKSWSRVAEKQEEGKEECRKLQSVKHFMQMQ